MSLLRLVAGLMVVGAATLTACANDAEPDQSSSAADAPVSSSSGDSPSGDVVANGGASDDAFDVCGLLTAADLEAVFGSPFDDGEAVHQEQTGGDQCIWGNTDAPPVKQFSISVLRDGHLSAMFEDNDYTVQDLYEETKEMMGEVEELDLGDDAYLVDSQIAVLDGDTLYDFSTVLGTSPEAIAGLRTLAAQVIG